MLCACSAMALRHLIKHRINVIITMRCKLIHRVTIALIVTINGERRWRYQNYDFRFSKEKKVLEWFQDEKAGSFESLRDSEFSSSRLGWKRILTGWTWRDLDGISIRLPFHILSPRYRGWCTGVSQRKFRPGAGRRPEAGNVIRKGASSDVRIGEAEGFTATYLSEV